MEGKKSEKNWARVRNEEREREREGKPNTKNCIRRE